MSNAADPIAELRDRVLLIEAGSRDTCAVVARFMGRFATLEKAIEARAKSADVCSRAETSPERATFQEARDYVVVSDYGMNACRMTLSDAQAYMHEDVGCGSLAPGTRIMRLVPVDG
jgi:hypothetical protein